MALPPSVILPPVIAIIGSRETVLEYNDESPLARFSGSNVFSRLAKFEVVASNTVIDLFHIRCHHNKKFFRRMSETNNFVSPESDEPNEDRSSWSCTLFEAKWRSTTTLELHSSGRNDWIRLVRTGNGADAMEIGDTANFFGITNLETLVRLPRHLAFKGSNDKFLNVVTVNNLPILRFQSTDEDLGRENAWFEVATDSLGWAKIKTRSNQMWWRHDASTNAIVADQISEDPPGRTTWFRAVKVDNEAVALLPFNSTSFCGLSGTDDRLSAVYPTIPKEARLVIRELVRSRKIYDVAYDLANAIISGESPELMANANSSNSTSADNEKEFTFTHTESRSSTWTSDYSWMVGMSVEKKLRIPFVGSFGIEISGEYSESHEWGEAITTETSLETTYAAVVPPHSSITVSMMATKGSCDVPYSYSQRDLLYDGNAVVYRKDDGLFKGANAFNFRYEVAKTSRGASRAHEQITYEEQKIPIPFEAKRMQSAATLSSLYKTIPEPKEMAQENSVPQSLVEEVGEVTIT